MVDLAENIWRAFSTDGLPSSGAHEPVKAKIREWGTWVEGWTTALGSTGSLLKPSKAALDADLDHDQHTMAWVLGDATVANNGVYRKIDVSGSGSWLKTGELPYSFIKAADVGAGTANAIVATSSIPIPAAAFQTLILMNVFEANGAPGPVTLAINGEAPKSVKTNTNNELAEGYLMAGMLIAFVFDGTSYRLVTDVVASSIVAAAEAAAADAIAAAAGVNLPLAVASTFLVQKADVTGYETKTFAQVRDIVDGVVPTFRGKWTNADTLTPPQLNDPHPIRNPDRVLLGVFATDNVLARTNSGYSWGGVNDFPVYMPRDADLAVGSVDGSFAIVGMSRTSDCTFTPRNSTAGGGFYSMTNTVGGFSRAGYFEYAITAAATGGSAWGLEIVGKNLLDNRNSTPYFNPGGSHHITMVAGSDPSVGGTPRHPTNSALFIVGGTNPSVGIVSISRTSNVVSATFDAPLYVENGLNIDVAGVANSSFNATGLTLLSIASNGLSATWAQTAANASSSGGTATYAVPNAFKFNTGLLYLAGSLVGEDTDAAKAIALAAGQRISMVAEDGVTGAFLVSRISAGALGISQKWTDNTLTWANQSNASPVLTLINTANNGNYIRIENSAAGAAAVVRSFGEVNAPLATRPRGTGGNAMLSGTAALKRFEVDDVGIAFFGGATAAKQTGVAVTAAGIHAALVAYGMIS